MVAPCYNRGMNPEVESHSEPERQESLADRVFTFLGLMILCGGGLLVFQTVRVLWSEWFIQATDISDRRTIEVVRGHFLTGIVCLTSGAFFIRKRWLLGGMLLLMAIWIFLGSAGER